MVRGLLYDLLDKTPIFDDGHFDIEKSFSLRDLTCFVHECQNLKAVIENALEFEVSTDPKMAVRQLNAILGVIGQRASNVDKFKVAGETVYRYRLDKERLELTEEIAARRRKQQGWPWVHEHYGWIDDSEDE
jgi:hypothetical protein